MRISDNYNELTPGGAAWAADWLQKAWQNPDIPLRQYEIVKNELQNYRHGLTVPVFEAAMQCFRLMTQPIKTVLDVGASAGYYGEVLDIAGILVHYTALDYSAAFERLAQKLYPGIDFKIGDACALPFGYDSYDVVLSSANIMHIADYAGAIHEAARVAHKYVILHRTPVVQGETRYFTKEAYGVPCLEIHFSEGELLALAAQESLQLVFYRDIVRIGDMTHKTYLFEKVQVEPYASNPNV